MRNHFLGVYAGDEEYLVCGAGATTLVLTCDWFQGACNVQLLICGELQRLLESAVTYRIALAT